MALVLCTGVDSVLMTTRKLILQSAGHNVVTAMDEESVKAACERQVFEVAVIGQAASTRVKRQLMRLIRRHCPSAKVLELYSSSTGRLLEDADSWLAVPADVPQDLAERVTAMAAAPRSNDQN